MSMLSSLDLIRRVPMFSRLELGQAALLAEAMTKRRFRRGELLVRQGELGDTLFVLLNGRARVTATNSRGREVILATLHPGEPVGEMSLIDGEPHDAHVRAEVALDALALRVEHVEPLLPRPDSLGHALLGVATRRMRRADRKIESLALSDVHGRVERALIDSAVRDVDGQAVVREKISRQDIAKMVGASREMVSRVMKDLEGRRFFETRGDGSLILCPQSARA